MGFTMITYNVKWHLKNCVRDSSSVNLCWRSIYLCFCQKYHKFTLEKEDFLS